MTRAQSAAILSAISAIGDHIPDLTDEDDLAITERIEAGDEDGDNADLALRTCPCGRDIDGFYDYADHLKEVLRAMI